MCVECGCEVPQTESEEVVHDGEPVVHLLAGMAGDFHDRIPVALDPRVAAGRAGRECCV